MKPAEYRLNDKHNTLLFRYDDGGIYFWNKSKREEEYVIYEEILELVQELEN